MQNAEMVAFNIISNAGEASANFHKAIKFAEAGKFVEADEAMKLGNEAASIVHKEQTKLIHDEASGNKYEIGILMIHAQDHLMNAMLLKDIANSFIKLNKKIYDNGLL